MISPCKVKGIIDNLGSVDDWNILKREQGTNLIEFGGMRSPLETLQMFYIIISSCRCCT